MVPKVGIEPTTMLITSQVLYLVELLRHNVEVELFTSTETKIGGVPSFQIIFFNKLIIGASHTNS